MNPLKELGKQGQAVWLDYIRRSLITGGELEKMIEEDGVTGITVNPTILEKAIAGSDEYDDQLAQILEEDAHADARKLYEELVIQDIQRAADILRPIYDASDGADGYISLELSPDLARDTEGTIAEAHEFWRTVDRPNLLLKVPATPEGIPAIEALIAEGINVNITLMFSLSHYEAVANAYINGLKRCREPCRVASVASFFVSRVDKIVDGALEDIGTPEALKLRGKIATANSKMAYRRFKELFSGQRWEGLSRKGAKVQRVLWASTGTKNPEYSDVLYVEGLIGPDTVNTMPPATMAAFKDHGRVRPTLEEDMEEAENALKALAEVGVDLHALTERLQIDGVAAFAESYDKLLDALAEKGKAVVKGLVPRQNLNLGEYGELVQRRLESWERSDFNKRLWARDYTLWSKDPVPEIVDRLGWLMLPEISHEQLDRIMAFAEEIKNEGFRHVVLLGMGGSSLAPELFQATFGNEAGYPELTILDSSHPGMIRALEKSVDFKRTLFIVASKSGTTLETMAFFSCFWDRMERVVSDAGEHFIAITDPGTPLEKLALKKSFRRTFLAVPDLGGRYSALTAYGLVPVALIGIKVHKLLDRAWVAAEGCAFCVSERRTPGLALGAALGELARMGRNKVTFLATPSIESFPIWLEQLIAESTGKDGKGIVPIVGEPPVDPSCYGKDRFFVLFILEGDDGHDLERSLRTLQEEDHPTVVIRLTDKSDLGMEIFRWEVAVASAGAVLGINPFNQPDVELAKELARETMSGKEIIGAVEVVKADEAEELANKLGSWLSQSKVDDYIAIHAYLEPTEETTIGLQRIREALLRRTCLATSMGYGPRFLHSTGQLHKGGPNTGLFLQLVDEPAEELHVPETNYAFHDLIEAQSVGDYLALKQRGRRVLRINLGKDVASGLELVKRTLQER